MPDREKVIKGLKYLHDVKRWSPNESEESITARRNITEDALALLKAQEPKYPIRKQAKHGWFFYCPKCGRILNDMARPKYCSECGQAVKWE